MSKDGYGQLREYYKSNILRLVFEHEDFLHDDARCRLFTYDFSNETDNFLKTFVEYLPMYIENYDLLKHYDSTSEFLKQMSRRIWGNIEFHGDKLRHGLYGELFLDFYRRIYSSDDILAGYALRSSYASRQEIKGTDGFSFIVTNKKPTIVFSEAKFIDKKSEAISSLIEDITKHLDDEYLNKFAAFMLRQTVLGAGEHTEEMRHAVDAINKRIIQQNEKFIDAINALQYKVKFVYFAVCTSNIKTADGLEQEYAKVKSVFMTQTTKKTALNDCDSEIVFIPTNNSLAIKKEIIKYYG